MYVNQTFTIMVIMYHIFIMLTFYHHDNDESNIKWRPKAMYVRMYTI